MTQIKYHYALDECGNLTDINTLSEEDRHAHNYKCLGCEAEMLPRMGQVRTWHFAHRGDEACSSETYLHNLAKRLVKEKFDSADAFEIEYHRTTICSNLETCKFAVEYDCKETKTEKYDLKEYYDTCKEEQPVNGFVADLLLTSSQKPERDPILIEIQVSHKSTEEKINSGLKIIELKIKTEEDILALLPAPLRETQGTDYGFVRNKDAERTVKFFGFKREGPAPLAVRHIPHFYIHKSGKAYFDNPAEEFRSCREARVKNIEYASMEIAIDSNLFGREASAYAYGYMIARQNGLHIKTCHLCKYQKYSTFDGQNICCLYKKCSTPHHPESNEAITCSYYREDKAHTQEILATLPLYEIATERKDQLSCPAEGIAPSLWGTALTEK